MLRVTCGKLRRQIIYPFYEFMVSGRHSNNSTSNALLDRN
jgi:hypothetical protein